LRPAADAAEAELGDDACRGGIVDEVTAGEAFEVHFAEAIVHEGASRFRRVSVSPPGLADPIADLGLPRIAVDVADGADQFAVALDAAHELIVADGGDPQVGIDERIGM